ncbi:glycosyltransferase family 4 protein [Uliginosibacterium sp. TH139]|uniref:glycosyltransferase family 4 protein n=1 Tax=Uliginosibacterium sp. TH139 TaxID=2067453 RepID=UPI000C7A0EE8|nr:glycosyltransferase family 4 protein [Uliginosibacterium sp. TH139]PLK50056.1 hypothetical protein C0V76_06525 [Uliginosibacterium sp. TH139]
MKILLSAFACDPKMGSEPYVGWNWLKISSNIGRVWVVTRWQHKSNIEERLLSEGIKGVQVCCFDVFGFSGLDHRAPGIKVYYVAWQFFAFLYALTLHVRNGFCVAHHVTYNAMDFPGLMWLLPRCKFIWGPVGGGQTPPAMAKGIYGKSWRKEIVRAWMKEGVRFNPFVRLAVKRSSLVMFANDETRRRFDGFSIRSAVNVLETAVQDASIGQGRDISARNNINVVWVGRVEARKALGVALDAVEEFLKVRPDISISLMVAGDGPDLDFWRGSVKARPDLQAVVRFLGSVDYSEVSSIYKKSDVMLFTSVQDTSGNVVLESMSKGIPVVAIDHQGAGEILRAGGGVLVPLGSYLEVVKGFCDALIGYAEDADLYRRHSLEAVGVMRTSFTWEAKEAFLKRVYDEI